MDLEILISPTPFKWDESTNIHTVLQLLAQKLVDSGYNARCNIVEQPMACTVQVFGVNVISANAIYDKLVEFNNPDFLYEIEKCYDETAIRAQLRISEFSFALT